MDTLREIKAAIVSLTPEDYRRLVDWFRAREDARWDEQMDRDSASGKLDFLFEEAESESREGLLRPWPPEE